MALPTDEQLESPPAFGIECQFVEVYMNGARVQYKGKEAHVMTIINENFNIPVDDTQHDFPFTEDDRALWEVSEEEKTILDQGMADWEKELAAHKKEREKISVKGKVQKLKGETQLKKEILANADKVEEEAATAKVLRAGDKATAAAMKEQERHDDDYDPNEENQDDTS